MNPYQWPDEEARVNFAPLFQDAVGGPAAEPSFGRSALGALAGPEAASLVDGCRAGRELLHTLAERLARHRIAEPNLRFPLDALPADDRRLIGQVLGRGEVRLVLDAAPRIEAQEAVMAGVWQVRERPSVDGPVREWIEVGAIPAALQQRAVALPHLPAIPAPPAGVMNVMPVLAELRDASRCYRAGDACRVVNLTLLPMTPTDLSFLHRVLGDGGLAVESSGYGACRIHATAWARIWSVQYFNAMDTLILDTLEVGAIPAAACAAQEDIEDSEMRLREILTAYLE